MELKNKRDIIESEHLKDEKELEMVKERMFNDYRQIPTYQRAYDEAKKKYELWVSEEYPIRKNALIDGKEKCLDEIDESFFFITCLSMGICFLLRIVVLWVITTIIS